MRRLEILDCAVLSVGASGIQFQVRCGGLSAALSVTTPWALVLRQSKRNSNSNLN